MTKDLYPWNQMLFSHGSSDLAYTYTQKQGFGYFTTICPNNSEDPGELEELLQMETEFRKREPFASLAQHIHFVCRRK